MRHRRAGGLAVVMGLVLVCTPIYRDTLVAVGLAPVVDPIAALGFPSGYPVAVGSAAVATGGAVSWQSRLEQPATMVLLAGGTIGAFAGIGAVLTLTEVPFVWAVLIGLAGAAPGFAAVRGAATEQTHRRIGTALVVCSLSPFAIWQLVRGTRYGGFAGVVSLLLVIALAVYTVVLSYPFAKLGHVAG